MAGPAALIRADRKFPFVGRDTAFRSTALAGPRIMGDPVHYPLPRPDAGGARTRPPQP
jgi:hypothetical protein